MFLSLSLPSSRNFVLLCMMRFVDVLDYRTVYLTETFLGLSFRPASLGRRPISRRISLGLPLDANPRTWTQTHRHYSSSAHQLQPQLTHVDSATGRPTMVDVSDKLPSKRSATAIGRIYIPQVAYDLIASSGDDDTNLSSAQEKAKKKGDVLTVAQLAGIMGAKRTSDLIPLCHPLALSKISMTLVLDDSQNSPSSSPPTHSVLLTATVSCEGKTGVEMEALTAVSVGALTVWDMLKAVAGESMTIGDIMVVRKEGGKSGGFVRPGQLNIP